MVNKYFSKYIRVFLTKFSNFAKSRDDIDVDERIQKIVDNTVKNNKYIFGVTVNISSDFGAWSNSSGNLSNESQYFIASTTKLYITAIIMKLRYMGKLKLTDKISMYIPKDIMDGLHIYNGIEYSDKITIKHLLAHTSGLPDYFQLEDKKGYSLKNYLLSGNDKKWSFEESIDISKKLSPIFKPGQKNQAHYSDTNYQLLGKIIEVITKTSLHQALEEYIFKPLKLEKTYLYFNNTDTLPAYIYYKSKQLDIPMAMNSFGADGGIVSTSSESMVFLKAFFNGKLFPKEYLKGMQEWNKIFFPLRAGIGITSLKFPRGISSILGIPNLIGHSGLSGAFAYYNPDKNIYLTGSVNQIDNPSLSYKMLIKIINSI